MKDQIVAHHTQKGFEFVVEGKGEFPVSMLRYDACFPKNDTDAGAILGFHRDRVLVTLQTDRRYLTPARWESFSWKLVEAYPFSKDGVKAWKSII